MVDDLPVEGSRELGRVLRAVVSIGDVSGPIAEQWSRWRDRYLQLARVGWFSQPARCSVLVVGYRVMRSDLPDGYSAEVDLGDCNGLVVRDRPLYAQRAEMSFADERNVHVKAENLLTEAPLGTYLMLATPYQVDGREDEPAARGRIATAAGLIGMLEGHNAIYETVFENVIPFISQTSVTTEPITNPAAFPRPDMSPRRMELWQGAARAIAAKGPSERARLNLGLRWLQRGMSSRGVDAFLAYWIAIETIAMPDGTDIGPLEERLGDAYGITRLAARKRFQVGRIFWLRGEIVHKGKLNPVQDRLLDYMAAVAGDLLIQALGIPSEMRIERVLREPGFRLRDYLP